MGLVYLLHFERSYKHARHYIGCTEDLERRLAQHRAGRGSPLVAAAIADGIDFQLAATWPGNGAVERRLHRAKNSPARLCPICAAERTSTTPDLPRAPGDVETVVLELLAKEAEPLTLPAIAAHLRDRGSARVGSLHGRLELLAKQGRLRKCWLLGEIAWTTVSG